MKLLTAGAANTSNTSNPARTARALYPQGPFALELPGDIDQKRLREVEVAAAAAAKAAQDEAFL